MADEIKLKAPTVEQQVVVNINGEEKLRSFADTLDKISNNKNLQKYWKTQQELINATADAYGNFQKKASKDSATELIKVTNALKAMSGTDLSNILPDFDKISKAMTEAQKVAGNIDSAFSVKGFKEAFDSFETLKAYSEDIEKIFSHFGVSSDISELQNNVRALEGEVEKLTRRLTNAKNANEELRNEFENFKYGSGFADKLNELDNLKTEMSYLRAEAEETFRQFLKLNNITEDGYDRDGYYDDNRFREYFQNIQSGYMSASDAIRQFKTEYSYLLEESFKTNNDTFGLEQLQAFSNKLDSIFRQVEETSTKINDIISNGVITKSVENLSMDSSLSDSQRSLFGNLLQDEESLKSITALFQKLIEESNKTKNSELFNSEQLQQVLSIFDRIENSLSSLRNVISDVGDGEEFSPLLKALNDIKEAASNIKLNFNMDLGDEVSERLNQKVSQASARQLEAYRKLFSAMKGTGKTNKEMLKFFEPDEASVTELIGTYKGIIERAEKQFKVGNSNIYKKYLGTEYDALKREITNANKQLSRADSKRSENGILGDLFGNTKDLSEVIEQLNKIVSKLDEISSSASEFKNVFKEGFNVTASVEEIDKLTNRVKELEDELSKVKLNPVSGNKSNISSGTQIKDVFQGDDKVNTDASTTAIKEESQALDQVSTSAKDAATSKEKFANANKEVKASADETVVSVDKEISALEKAGNRFESQAAGLAIKPDDQHQFSSWKKQLEDLNIKIAEYKSKVENLSKIDIADEAQINKAKTEIEELGKSIKETINAMTKTPQTKRGWTDIGASKAAEKVANVLKQNTKMSKEARDAIRAYYNELRSGNPSQPIDEILVKVNQLVQKERELGRVGKSFGEIFKEKVIYGGAAQLAGMVGFYDVINVGREAFNVIKDLDSAYTEMRKVSDETTQSLKNFQSASFDVAKQVGVTALEIQNSAADFMRLGYSLEEASKLSEDANIYANVGDMDISEATEHMISSIQAWQSEFSSATEASTNIINRYNEIGNRFAITSADIGSAMERSAAALKAGGNDLNESIGIITAGNLIQQDADTTANAIKVLSLRLRGAKADLESMNEETDGLVESTSKMREQIQALTGVDIMIDDSTFKSTAKIIQEIGAEWSNLSDVSQAATLELLAGKTRASTVAGLIENYQTIGEVIEAAEESENSARIENEKYLDSMEGRLNLMTSQLQEMASVSLNDNLLKEGISALTKILELITDIVDTFGLLPTAAGIGGVVAGFKNVGQAKMWACLIYAYPC